MNAQDVQQKIAAALSREEPLNSMECKLLLGELAPALGAVESRIDAIRPGERDTGSDGNMHDMPAGELRMKALTRGTPAEIASMDEELKELRIVRQQLRAQRDPVLQRMEIALDEEAAARLPELHRSLNTKVTAALAEAQAFKESLGAVATALHEVEAAYGRLRQAYQYKGVLYPRISGTEEQVERIDLLANAANGSLCPPGLHPRAMFFIRGSLGMVDDRHHLDRGKPGLAAEVA